MLCITLEFRNGLLVVRELLRNPAERQRGVPIKRFAVADAGDLEVERSEFAERFDRLCRPR